MQSCRIVNTCLLLSSKEYDPYLDNEKYHYGCKLYSAFIDPIYHFPNWGIMCFVWNQAELTKGKLMSSELNGQWDMPWQTSWTGMHSMELQHLKVLILAVIFICSLHPALSSHSIYKLQCDASDVLAHLNLVNSCRCQIYITINPRRDASSLSNWLLPAEAVKKQQKTFFTLPSSIGLVLTKQDLL